MKAKQQRYQLLPPLTHDEFEALKTDIAQRGVQVPVDKDEKGNVLDGYHRVQACEELRIKRYPVRVVAGLTEQQKRHHALSANLTRRHLTTKQKGQVAAEELRRSPKCSDHLIARLTALDPKTVGSVRRRLVIAGEIPPSDQREGLDGRTCRVPTILARSPSELRRATDALRTLGSDAPDRDMTVRQAERLARNKHHQEMEIEKVRSSGPDDPIQIVHSDFRKLKLPAGSASLVLTDPPYGKEFLPLWADLSACAARWLRPGGVLLTYTGHLYLPEVLTALGRHLTYWWQMVLIHDGDLRQIHPRYIQSAYKPLLLFVKGAFKPRKYLLDVWHGTGREKRLHPWQQGCHEAAYFIDALTRPGELVVDPLAGSCTTAEATLIIGNRRYVGCDVDQRCVDIGRARIANVRAELKKTGGKKTRA